MHISSETSSATLQNDADTDHTWSSQIDMTINVTKIKALRIDFSKSRGPFTQLYIGSSIEIVSQSKILGVIISDDLKWNQHVEYITGNASQRLHILVLCRRAGIPSNEMLLMYTTKIRPVLEYACAAWHPGITQYLTDDIERVQIRAMRIIFPGLLYGDALVCSQLPTLKDRRNDVCLRFSNQWNSLITNYTIFFQIPELVDINFVNLVNTNQRKQKLTKLMVPW